MQINGLTTQAFRNLSDTTLELHPRFNVIAGDNAQGKTNLLEALDLTLGQRPFRATRTAELIRFGAETAALRAHVQHADLEHDVRVTLRSRGRAVELDGKGLRGAASWPRGLTTVLFTPDDLSVPKGPPSERRRLLDRAVTSVWPAYASLSRDYTRALSARNRLLRDRPVKVEPLLDAYDVQLAQLGAKITLARGRYVTALRDEFQQAYRNIGDDRSADLVYQPGVQTPDDSASDVRALELSIVEQLSARRREDLARRVTSVGPHHDDLGFELEGRVARTYASQGQLRTLVLAFKMSQISHTNQVIGHYPALLLDDVSSELDQRRNAQLFDFISNISCQLFVTTTRPGLIPAPDRARYFTVIKGKIT